MVTTWTVVMPNAINVLTQVKYRLRTIHAVVPQDSISISLWIILNVCVVHIPANSVLANGITALFASMAILIPPFQRSANSVSLPIASSVSQPVYAWIALLDICWPTVYARCNSNSKTSKTTLIFPSSIIFARRDASIVTSMIFVWLAWKDTHATSSLMLVISALWDAKCVDHWRIWHVLLVIKAIDWQMHHARNVKTSIA